MESKHIKVDHIGFTEIGGAGELVYRVVRFRGYLPDDDEHGDRTIYPFIAPGFPPVEGADYNMNGVEVLYSLVNLFHILNNPEIKQMKVDEMIATWCGQNVQPYAYKLLSEEIKTSDDVYLDCEFLRKDASFYVSEFVKDLCNLGMAVDFHNALLEARNHGITKFARELYYEGRLTDTLPFLEKYSQYEDDEEYLKHINEDYDSLINDVLELVPAFKMTVQRDEKTGETGMYADIDSVFDIAWLAFAKELSHVAPAPDTAADADLLYTSASYICCLACGQYVKRKGSKQRYCDNPDCQAVRNRLKSKEAYYRKKAKNTQK